jgi:hypothetical protein
MTEKKALVYFDLDSKQYDMETLIKNINILNLLKIVRKQKLTLDFIKNYILNDEYQCTPEEQYIDKNFVLQYQPHINPEDL